MRIQYYQTGHGFFEEKKKVKSQLLVFKIGHFIPDFVRLKFIDFEF